MTDAQGNIRTESETVSREAPGGFSDGPEAEAVSVARDEVAIADDSALGSAPSDPIAVADVRGHASGLDAARHGVGSEVPEQIAAAEAAGAVGASEVPGPAAADPNPIEPRGPAEPSEASAEGSGGVSAEPDEAALRLAEAVVFASATPVTARGLSQLLPDDVDAAAVIAALRLRYAGRGIELVEIGGGLRFRTAADLAPRLRKVVQVPRRLPRVALETLAIVAYHQPVTRPEIEDMRGTALSQQTLDVLLENDLIVARGRKETPGRPTLWGTTAKFLEYFGLRDIRELPRRQDLLLEPVRPATEGERAAEGTPAAGPGEEAAPGEDAKDGLAAGEGSAAEEREATGEG